MISISASSLNKFWTCPHQLYLSNRWKRRYIPEHLANGTQAHEMMENGEPNEDATKIALNYYKQLRKGEEILGYTVLDRENKEKFIFTLPSGREIKIVRIIDVYARDKEGNALVVDYKTTSKNWKLQGSLYPKAQGFQAEIYSLPSPTSPFDLTEDIKLLFLIATQRTVTPIQYQRTQEDKDNLLKAMEIYADAVDRKMYPKLRGFGCKYCDYSSVCYQVPGYQMEYEERKNPYE